tara:strand:+ start:1274 stop:1432 length:159 start_codon:yes stop_codon:yes gene_type:complete
MVGQMRGFTIERRRAEYEAKGAKCPRWAMAAGKDVRLEFEQVSARGRCIGTY